MNIATMTLNPWDTLAGLRDFRREVDRLFAVPDGGNAHAAFPPVNLTSNQDEALVTAAIPGVEPEQLDLSLVKGHLVIRGTLPDNMPQGEGAVCHRRELGRGNFSRAIPLPFEVEEGKILAKYDRGMLTVTLPRAEKTKPRSIPVIAN